MPKWRNYCCSALVWSINLVQTKIIFVWTKKPLRTASSSWLLLGFGSFSLSPVWVHRCLVNAVGFSLLLITFVLCRCRRRPIIFRKNFQSTNRAHRRIATYNHLKQFNVTGKLRANGDVYMRPGVRNLLFLRTWIWIHLAVTHTHTHTFFIR